MIQIDRALCLPAFEVEALQKGHIIAAIPRTAVQKGWTFALYPYNALTNESPLAIQYWAKCERCTMLHELTQLEGLSHSTVWERAELQEVLQQRQHLFLVHLRVYCLSESLAITSEPISTNKFGKFVGLSALGLLETISLPIKISEILPVLSDDAFNRRQQRLEIGKPSPHSDLEKLQSQLIQLNDPKTQGFKYDLKVFLGQVDYEYNKEADPDLNWIKTIASIGNSSDGDTFEKLVRKSLIKLGFSNSNTNPQASLDPNGCGGAGGLDFYCQKPYQIVGECKATRTETVSDGTPAQLIKLGHKHLQQKYNDCIKIIMAAGQLNSHAKQTAIGNHINVMRPETLQKLVELKAKHPGSINLIELKPCLENPPFGEDADLKVNAYIDEAWQRIKERSNIIQTVKKMKEAEPNQPHFEVSDIKAEYNANFAKQNNRLDIQKTREILLELSSLLTGYLGRIKTVDGSDRFYFLRELHVD